MPHEDWLEYRKQGIGGSDASVVCGISRYKSPVELWMEKTGQLSAQEAGEAAYWGTQLEALVRAEFTKRTGIEVKQIKQLLQSEEHSFMLASLDGICEVPDVGICVFEAKTASAYRLNGGIITMKRSYHDKHGNEILAGMTIRHEDGDIELVYAITDASGGEDLGIMATNPR